LFEKQRKFRTSTILTRWLCDENNTILKHLRRQTKKTVPDNAKLSRAGLFDGKEKPGMLAGLILKVSSRD